MSRSFEVFPINSVYLAGPVDFSDPTNYYDIMLEYLPTSAMVFLPGKGQYERAVESNDKTYMVNINKFAMFESELVIIKYPEAYLHEGTTRELVWLVDALENGYYHTGDSRTSQIVKHDSVKVRHIILWLEMADTKRKLSCYLQHDIDRMHRIKNIIFRKCYSIEGVVQAIKEMC